MMVKFLSKFKAMAFLMVILTSLLVCACASPEEEKIDITVDKAEITISEKGGTASIKVTAGSLWTSSSVSGTWLSITPDHGSADEMVTITVEPNTESFEERSSEITFRSEGKSASVTVIQAGMPNLVATVPGAPSNGIGVAYDFKKSIYDFTIENKELPSALSYVWAQTEDYGLKASAYYKETNYKTESWIVSPEIDLTGYSKMYLSFSHTYRYCNDNVMDQMMLKITKDGGKTWNTLEIPRYPDGNSWAFVNSGDIDLSAYCKSKIKVAFVYKSSETSAPTWEIDKLSISTETSGTDIGNTYKGVPAWLELPKVNKGDNFIIHAVKDKSSKTGKLRNFSMIFDSETLVAPWIAYPLCDSYTKKTVQRTDAWQLDPFLSDAQQPILFKSGDYYINGFERGHQIASADRLASTELNEQTFYYSNMAPMYAGDNFNSGVWGVLEDQVRKWSSSKVGTDTLYVVTGSVTKNSTLTVKDNVGKTVTVPSGFYKVLLRYSKNSAENGGYCGVGFYLDHKPYSTTNLPSDSVYSIDALEEKLGIDFFPNLEALVGKETAEKIEAESPVYNSFWGLK